MSVIINGRLYDPKTCVNDDDPDGEHFCVHDWRVDWGNKEREVG